jgi:hypothetical protein
MMAYVKVYHPSGAEVYLPIHEDFGAAGNAIGGMVGAGWLLEKPPKQHSGVIGWVVRRSKIEDDGSETPIIDFYIDHPDMVYRILAKYLNNDKDVADFEAAMGVKVSALPYSDSSAPLKRGDAKTAKYFFRLPAPVRIYYRDNPAYNPDEEDAKKRKPQYLFSSYGERIAQESTTGGKPTRENTAPFEWDKAAVKRLLGDARMFEWTPDQVKVAAGLKNGWEDLKKFKTYDEAWNTVKDFLNQPSGEDVPF